MPYILNIETSTTVCSVSVSENSRLLHFKEINNGYTHAENLHVFIEETLKELQVKPSELTAVSVSRGPGSYTGLRIGVSAAKGLAYALNIPLISVDTLQIMAQAVSNREENSVYCPMLDARRMEVYTCVYDHKLDPKQPIEAIIVDENSIQKFKTYSKIYFFGDGMPKCRELLRNLDNAQFVDNIYPSSKYMCNLAFEKLINQKFENSAYFEPFYLKDFLVNKS